MLEKGAALIKEARQSLALLENQIKLGSTATATAAPPRIHSTTSAILALPRPTSRQPIKPTFDSDIDHAFSNLQASDHRHATASSTNQAKKAALEESLRSHIAASRLRPRSRNAAPENLVRDTTVRVTVSEMDRLLDVPTMLSADAAMGIGTARDTDLATMRSRRGRVLRRSLSTERVGKSISPSSAPPPS